MTLSPEPSASVHLEKDITYLPEVWTWFALGVIIIALRWFVRTRTVGLRGLHPDDYLTILYLVLWTANAIIVYVTYYSGGNVDVTADQASTLSDHDIWVLAWGSKWEFASWYTYSGTIWILKFQVLFFYQRLNFDLISERSVNFIFVITGLAYAALLLTISLSCRPYHYNWQINPLPGPECTFRPQNFWTLVVLNVTTDIIILSIPAPLLFRLRISWPRKVGVSVLLLSGLFMIATAIIRAVQTLTGAPSVININKWGFRETGVGMIAVNAAMLLPLFTKRFWRQDGFPARRHHYQHLPVVPPPVRPPQPTERNRKPSGGPFLMKINEVLLWTQSALANSMSGTKTSGRRGAGSGRASSSRHGTSRGNSERTRDVVSSSLENEDLEQGISLEGVGGHEQEDQERDPEKSNEAKAECTRVDTASTDVPREDSTEQREGESGPSADVVVRSSQTSPV